MATILYLNSATSNFYDSTRAIQSKRTTTTRGTLDIVSGTSTNTVTSSNNTSDTFWPDSSWISDPVSSAFTMSGNITVTLRQAVESATQANVGAKVYVAKVSPTGTVSAVGNASSSEFSTTAGNITVTITPTSTAFAKKDRILIYIHVVGVGTLALTGSRTASFQYAGTSAGTDDTNLSFTENFSFLRRVIVSV